MKEVDNSSEPNWSVLLIDSDRISGVVLQKLLEVEGYNVSVANDGLKAWEMIQENHYSLILMDRQLPNLDGLELCKKIRSLENRSYTYIVFLNEMTQKQEMIEALEAGADDYLTKPYDYVELLARLNSASRILEFEKVLHEKNEELKALALKDKLTSAKNRAAYEIEIEKEFKRAKRYKHPLSIAICDIDNFKSINEKYGHTVGDQILIEFVRRLYTVVRIGIDSVFRYAGETFVISLPETGPDSAKILASRVQYVVEGIPFEVDDISIDLGVSFGVSGYTKNDTENESYSEEKINSLTLFNSTEHYLQEAKKIQDVSIKQGPII